MKEGTSTLGTTRAETSLTHSEFPTVTLQQKQKTQYSEEKLTSEQPLTADTLKSTAYHKPTAKYTDGYTVKASSVMDSVTRNDQIKQEDLSPGPSGIRMLLFCCIF